MSFFNKGGPVMWPLLACSLIATTVILERLFFCLREQAKSRRHAERAEHAIEALAAGRVDEAETLARAAHSREGRLVLVGITHLGAVMRDALETHASGELDNLRRGLPILDTIVTLAPMLGILGTVTGIIGSFNMLSSDGIGNPAGVASGIAEALITTAAGLVVSMIALIPFNALASHVRRVARRLEQVAHAIEVASKT